MLSRISYTKSYFMLKNTPNPVYFENYIHYSHLIKQNKKEKTEHEKI